MRVLFLGTPSFALPSLEALASRHGVVAVITQPDRPAGRGRRLTPPPVAVRARELGIPVLQPDRLRDVRAQVEALAPDLGVTVAYGKIIPRWLLDLPAHGCINLHPSLLPKYRGASPIQRAILHGDAVTGVTVIRQTAELDAGDILAQREVPILPDDTAGTLEARLAQVGARLLVEVVDAIGRGEARPAPQDPAAASYFGKLTKEDGRIDWTHPAAQIERHIRAMEPWPKAFTFRGGERVAIRRGRVVSDEGAPGCVLRLTEEGFVVGTGEGALEVVEVQPASGRRMSAADYARGHRLTVGEVLG
ncbi:MAG: methionyl-tRNA formyltransferase [Armatimonadota bacterium]|nr:methionyl-tRNA formyltransferase [Armatimonadota bacterium]MDR5696653.1 methionyl-tRNA formyltransferase [Armatimonadota bacterium]